MSDYAIRAAMIGQDRMSAAFRSAGRGSQRFARTTSKSMGRASTSVKNFGSVFSGVLGAHTFMAAGRHFGGMIKGIVKSTSQIEDAVANFTPLMGGAERATNLVDRLNETASTTPFQFGQISDSVKQLLPVMNGNIERTIETFRMMGDTAGGNAQKMQTITRGFTKAMLKGKVDLESLNMIAEAGIPIFDQLASTIGTEVNASFFKMVSAGEIATDDLTKTFRKMTSEGGIFFGGMEIASQTLSGVMSTLRDEVGRASAAIGMTFIEEIKTGTKWLTKIARSARAWTEENQELIKLGINKIVDGISDMIGKLKSFISLTREYGTFNVLIESTKQLFGAISSLAVRLFENVKLYVNAVKESGVFNVILKNVETAVQGLIPLFKILEEAVDMVFGFIVRSGILDLVVAKMKFFGAGIRLASLAIQSMWKIAKPIFEKILGFLEPIVNLFLKFEKLQFAAGGGILNAISNRLEKFVGGGENESQPQAAPAAAPAAPNQANIERQEMNLTGDINITAPEGFSTNSRVRARRGRAAVKMNDLGGN